LINDSGAIFFITGQTKIPFANYSAFKGLGYSLKNVIKADSSAYALSSNYKIDSSKQAHPWGSWLVYKGTIYYSHESGMIGIPSWDVLSADWGEQGRILKMNQADINILSSNPKLPVLEVRDARIY
jgi:hypothetical protein